MFRDLGWLVIGPLLRCMFNKKNQRTFFILFFFIFLLGRLENKAFALLMILIYLFYWSFEAAEIDNCICTRLVNIDGSYYCFCFWHNLWLIWFVWLGLMLRHCHEKHNILSPKNDCYIIKHNIFIASFFFTNLIWLVTQINRMTGLRG